ncbi:unnamed protein product [marine sediment metagenome]|uniref:Uncharacterized protein n=1 Tax=marine sediment metagenome TaxID=412755 RepID=X1R9G0_9ZZZZ
MNETSEENKPERKIIILDSDECPPCEQIKRANKEKIESGEIKVLAVTSDEALELLEKAGAPDKIKYPAALVEDDKGVRVCDIYHSEDITLVACGNEIIAIREPPEEELAIPQPEEPPQSPSH